MAYANKAALVSTKWLSARLEDPAVKIIDASWYMPAENRDPAAEFVAEHIPGAVFFDIDAIADTSNPLPHMFPGAEQFAGDVAALGISNSDHVVCYDGGVMMAASRAWWMFRAFGHDKVSVLNGGFRKWKSGGQTIVSDTQTAAPGSYDATLNAGMVRDAEQMIALINGQGDEEQIIDARSSGRFHGTDPEPRAGLRGGHMPGALNVPVSMVLNEDNTMKPDADLKGVFAATGFGYDRPVVTSCGSGISAALLLLALHLVGHEGLSLYDGSWSEWGARADTPIYSR